MQTYFSLRTLAFDYLFDHAAVNISEPPIDAIVVERQLFRVEAKEVENGGVKIVNCGDFATTRRPKSSVVP